jgi:20S proteasome subunit alpha 7
MLPRSLYSVHDEDKPFELELAWICEASGREFRRVPADVLAAAEAAAKSALEELDMCVEHPPVGDPWLCRS